jgi:(p)ppGpp synthase/HD superfamily hydrolase
MPFEQLLKKLCKEADYEAVFIKSCDRTHNLETIGGLIPEKQQRMAQDTNNHLVGILAFVAEKLGIHEKVHLENKLFNLSYNVLKRK